MRLSNPRYLAYLNSSEWKKKRQAVLERSGGICERCRKFRVDEVHHLTYAHVFNEPLEDLQGVCKPCHAFLHQGSGLDPLADSIHIKVSLRVIEYWDSGAEKFRRVSGASLNKPRGFFDYYTELGMYQVPMSVFLDAEGKPVFDPSRWQPYRTAFLAGQHWMQYGLGGRGREVPPDPATVKREVKRQEQQKAEEEQRQQTSPESYTSFKGKAPATTKEVIALFRQYPRMVDRGQDGKILSVRATKTRGVSLSLQFRTREGWIRWHIYHAEVKLNEGAILLEQARGTWVMKDQARRPKEILEQFGIKAE
jgi:hypothetical protein